MSSQLKLTILSFLLFYLNLSCRGPAFLEYIDNLPSLNRPTEGPFRMPVVDKYKVRNRFLYFYKNKRTLKILFFFL